MAARTPLQQEFLALCRVSGKASLFVTHDVREALRLGTRIALLVDGRLDLVASPADFLRSQTAEARAYLACLEN